MVSLGGVLEASPHMPSVDYDGFLKATLAITHSMADVEQAFRRMVFNVLARNRDDHVRQHAYLMDARGDWRLAPGLGMARAAGIEMAETRLISSAKGPGHFATRRFDRPDH